MNKLKDRLKNQGGFTLVEMLIVVAIIAILIMISIPTFTAALEKSREAVDNANESNAASLAMVAFMMKDEQVMSFSDDGTGKAFYVATDITTDNAAAGGSAGITGTLSKTVPTKAYGQGTEAGANENSHEDMWIIVTVKDATDADKAPVIEVSWTKSDTLT